MINLIQKVLQQTVIRYIISGGTAAVVDLAVLYFLNSGLKMHYLPAAILAFLVAFGVSFTLQKFWTFRNHSLDDMHQQAFKYLGSALFGLGLNTMLMYVFVDLFHVFVILSQIFAGALVACVTFFISRNLVFKQTI
jgi:putative flippase GtrA